MGFFDDAWGGVSNAVNTVANAYTRVGGEAIKSVGQVAGNGAVGQTLQHLGTQVSDNFWGTWGPETGQAGAAPKVPTTSQPTIQDANTTATQQTLAGEQQNYWQRTMLTGGQGLLDNPKTASQTLLGMQMNEALAEGFDKRVTVNKDDEDLAAELIRDYNYLFGLRGTWNSHWTEIAQRIYPMDSFLFQNYSQLTQQGDKRNMEIYDSTGVSALKKFGAILDSLLTPTNQYWHHVRPQDDKLMQDKATRMWFEAVNKILFDERYSPKTNFVSQNQNQYKSLGAYGTGSMFIDDLDAVGIKGLRYKNVHLGEIYLQENHQGMIDAVCRHFALTARQAYLKFGEMCPESILNAYKIAPERQFFFLHWVKPRTDRDPLRRDYKGMQYASYYVSIDGNKLCAEGGYRSFPYSISRYEQAPNEAYGRSPAMDVLPAIKSLNEQKKTMLKQGHRVVDPVLLAHDDGIIDSFSLEPGSINAGGVSSDGRLLVQAMPVGNIQAGKEMMDEEKAIINDAFLVNLFQILTESPEMTATEVLEKVKEKGILLAPTVGRQQSEYLGPMIERELDILSRQGRLPPMPRLLKSATAQYKVLYDSPISRTREAEAASGAMHTLQYLGALAQTLQDPSVADVINKDKTAQGIARISGMPSEWMNDQKEVDAIRNQRAQQQQIQQNIQAAPAAAAMMKAGAGSQQGLPQMPPPQQMGGRKQEC